MSAMTTDDSTDIPEQNERLLEKQLQLFLSENLRLLDIPGLRLVGIEYAVPVGRIDILAEGPNQMLFAIETKRELATREDIGQLQSYMGALRLERPNANVRGIIVAAGLTDGARAALVVADTIEFYSYKVQFSLRQGYEKLRTLQAAEDRNAAVRTEKRYCMFCRDQVVANVMGNGSVICNRCKNVL